MKTIGEMSSSIKENSRKKRQLEIIEKAKTRIILDLLSKKSECNHEVLLILGEDPFDKKEGSTLVCVCPVCEKVLRMPANDPKTNETINNSIEVDVSTNPSSFLMRGLNGDTEYKVVTSFRKKIVEAAENNPGMTIEQLIYTFPVSWFTDPKAFDDESRVK